jgi:N-acetyl-1-D-myo-inositol-2-amino-2-deoxy-alpha-D-glucopyranoside deacetylase
VLVTYDDDGGYGHPDHVQAHRVATYATALAAVASYRPETGAAWDVAKVYWTAVPRSTVDAGVARAATGGTPFRVPGPDDLASVPDEWVTTTVDASDHLPAKVAALRAHATQVRVAEPFFALSNGIAQLLSGVEHYRLAKGRPGPPDPATGREPDLLAGLDLG